MLFNLCSLGLENILIFVYEFGAHEAGRLSYEKEGKVIRIMFWLLQTANIFRSACKASNCKL